MYYLKLFIGMYLMSLMAACSGIPKPGFPDQAINDEELIKKLETHLSIEEKISDYYDQSKTPEDKKQEKRNEIITGQLTLMDLHYNQFIQRITLNKQKLDTASDILSLGVSLAIPLTSNIGTKDTLGALSAGITGAKTSIDKNFFYEKTIPVLISQMNALRKKSRIPILQGIDKSASEYRLTDAIIDLNEYYFSGTFIGALQSIQTEAGKVQSNADNEIKKIISHRYATADRDLRDRISNWLSADKANVSKLEQWLLTRVPAVSTLAAIWVQAESTSKRSLESAIANFGIM